MPRKTERIRNHHKEIVKNLSRIVKRADKVPARPGEATKKTLKGDIDFLLKELSPHAEGEEKGLYPVADELIRKYGRPTAITIFPIGVRPRRRRMATALTLP